MTDKLPEDRPPDSSESRNSDIEGADELDVLLAEASSLAGELSGEVGEPESAPAPTAPREAEGDESEQPPDLDAQLLELDKLTRTTGSEIGSAPGEPDRATPPEEIAPPVEKGKGNVPDFMEEFTRPPNPPPDRESAGETGPPATPIPGVVSSKTLSRTSPANPAHSENARLAGNAQSPDGLAESDLYEADEESRRRPSAMRRLSAVMSDLGLSICDKSVCLLEKVNGPLGAIGEAPRRVIGWVAVATFATSVIVLLISLL
jgi:hypothetical protein